MYNEHIQKPPSDDHSRFFKEFLDGPHHKVVTGDAVDLSCRLA